MGMENKLNSGSKLGASVVGVIVLNMFALPYPVMAQALASDELGPGENGHLLFKPHIVSHIG